MPNKNFTRPSVLFCFVLFFLGGEGGLSLVNYCLKVECISRLNILKLVRKNFQEFLAQCSRRQMVVIKN